MYRIWGKRLLDLIIAIPALLALAPFLVAIGLIMWVILREFPLFIQLRPGWEGKAFPLVKLKTMRTLSDESGTTLPDDKRIVPAGALLRKLSIDELPQLWNVIKGEMSLVGPRPLLMDYLAIYTQAQARRHNVRPGITGWAQVNGRNALEWKEKFVLDIWYTENVSLSVDFKIMQMSLYQLFDKRRIQSVSGEVAGPFRG